MPCAFGDHRIESCPQLVEASPGTLRPQFVHFIKKRNVGPERRKRSEQQCAVPLVRKCVRKGAGIGGVNPPFTPVRRDGFEVSELGEDSCRRPGSPAWQPRVTVCGVADQCQIIRNRGRRDAEFADGIIKSTPCDLTYSFRQSNRLLSRLSSASARSINCFSSSHHRSVTTEFGPVRKQLSRM